MPGTPSSNGLTQPESWRADTNVRYKVSFAGISLLIVLDLLIAGYLYKDGYGSYGTGVLFFGLILVGVNTIGFDSRIRRKPSVASLTNTVDKHGRAALKVPYSSLQFFGYIFLMSIIGAGFVSVGLLLKHSNDSMLNGGTVFFAAIGLIFLTLPLLVVFGKFRRGKILLSEDGVYQRGWTFESFLPWSSLNLIDAVVYDGPQIRLLGRLDEEDWKRKQFTRLWRQDRLPPVQTNNRTLRVMEIPGKFVATNPAVIYHMLGFYYLYPANRAELGTSAAIDRARVGDFGP